MSKGNDRLSIAMIGTRGVPARYGGFETAIEEIGQRLVQRGHNVTVYCRKPADGSKTSREHLGMRLVHLPAVRMKALETLSHTAFSAVHATLRPGRYDAAFVFNSANAPFVPMLRLRRMPVAIHVDGLEWRRAKWGKIGRRYYRVAEALAVRWGDALIADAEGIADYYTDEFSADTTRIAYGAKTLLDIPTDRLAELGLVAGQFHLVVARFEPENFVDLILRGYHLSRAELPLVVVGTSPYADEYHQSIRHIASSDTRIRLIGPLWDQDQLNQLYAHALTYLHGHSIGGTNPSLLRAMGAGTAVGALNVGFNREVLGEHGLFFENDASLAAMVEAAEDDIEHHVKIGKSLQERSADLYNWDDVTSQYERLARHMADGFSRRGQASGHRNRDSGWDYDITTCPVPTSTVMPFVIPDDTDDQDDGRDDRIHLVA
jgi:glycosyltransferase involved in cell wall biosynthesis